MQVLSNHKSPISLPRVLDQVNKGKTLYPPLPLEPGLNTVDDEHFAACCEVANKDWLHAMMQPGAVRKDGKATLEVMDGKSPIASVKRKSVKEMVSMIRAAKSLDQLAALQSAEGDEPRDTVTKALEKKMDELSAED